MAIRLVRAEPKHVDEMGRICHEAFKGVQEGKQSPLDWTSVDMAREVLGMLVKRTDFYSVVALLDGQPVGSNFLSLMDAVAGVGPITVDPRYQGKGIGRTLMKDVLDYARRKKIERVRLLQCSFNVASLSLYASLGFDVREPIAVMQLGPAAKQDRSVRSIVTSDLESIERLSARIYKTSRRREVAAAMEHGFSTLVRERSGRISGYLTPGMLGHGVAESEDDAIALVGECARRLGVGGSPIFVPLGEATLYRRALNAGCRTIKVMNLMSLGPYDPPGRIWMPSVLY